MSIEGKNIMQCTSTEEAARYCYTSRFFNGAVSVITESRPQSRAFLTGFLSSQTGLPIDPENDSKDGVVEYMCSHGYQIRSRHLESWYEPSNGYFRDELKSDYPCPVTFDLWQACRLINREVAVYAETRDDVKRMISFIEDRRIPWKNSEGLPEFLPRHHLEFAYKLGAFHRPDIKWVPDGLYLSTGFVPRYTYDENGNGIGRYVETRSPGRESGGICVSEEKGLIKKLDDDYGGYSPVSVESFLAR